VVAEATDDFLRELRQPWKEQTTQRVIHRAVGTIAAFDRASTEHQSSHGGADREAVSAHRDEGSPCASFPSHALA